MLGVILQLSEGSVCWATVLYVGSRFCMLGLVFQLCCEKVLCIVSRFSMLGVILQLSEGPVCWVTVLYVESGLTVMLREGPVC